MSWNIAGARKIKEVWNWLEKFDIIALKETWLEEKDERKVLDELDRDYKWATKPAIRKKKRGRAMGVQLVGIRKDLLKNGTIEEWEEGLLVKGIELGQNKELFTVVTIYNNGGFRKLENELEGVINETEERGQSVILMGDVNARTGKDNVRATLGERNYKARESKDAVQNAEGKRLLSFCEENGLIIMNGRCEGDRKGNCTYVGEQGEEGSVIDYVIITEGKEYVMERMKVEIRIESDHV